MNKGGRTHALYMTFTALNRWTILLMDITHWLANSTLELCTTASADGSGRSIKIPDILSHLAKPKKLIHLLYAYLNLLKTTTE